jgi:hypothetical protein
MSRGKKDVDAGMRRHDEVAWLGERGKGAAMGK